MRAITRVATADDEDGWVACALGCAAAQLDRLAAACRMVTRRQSEARAERERLTWRWDDDGTLIVTARLAPENGAALMAAIEQAQRAAADEAGHTESPAGDSGPSAARDEQHAGPGCSRVEALATIIDHALTQGPRPGEEADTGRTHQVVIHVDHQALADTAAWQAGRCHLEDGPSIHPATLRRITCAGGTAFTAHHHDGTLLDIGRASRTVPARLRRAVLDRAQGRCQYPGCERRAWLQIHHVHHWIDGGPTRYTNLAVLCSRHHRAHHAGDYEISYDHAAPGQFRFHLADGTPIEHAPPPPPTTGDIRNLASIHTAAITAKTIQPDWAGDPLHLDYAVDVMTQTRRQHVSIA